MSTDSGLKSIRFDGILLAAGESRRMGYPKPLLEIGGRTFLAILAEVMLTALDRLIVVVGAHADAVRRAVPEDPRIVVVENSGYLRGQLSSIKAGISLADPGAAGMMVHLADHPMVHGATFGALIEEFRRSRQPIVIARYRGRRGHPVLFARAMLAELSGAPEDQGARVVVAADPERVAYVDTDDPGVLADLDTPEDLDRAGVVRPFRQQ